MTKGELAFQALENWCRVNGYPVPVPEYRFHPKRKWRMDAAWPAEKLAIEWQGGIHLKRGGHNTAAGISRDTEKACNAAVLGWRVMPCTYPQFNSGQVYEWLTAIFGDFVK